MAFKDVNEKTVGVKTSEMEVGSTLEGYVVGFPEGQYGLNIRMQVGDETKTIFPSGSLKWVVKDRKLKLGSMTRITRLQDEKIKGQKGMITATKFKVEQDHDDTVAVDASEAQPSSSAAAAQQDNFKEKIASLKASKQA